jgi:hypothetical protein
MDWWAFEMCLKLFVLGRPGSGKSTVAHFIEKLANREQWSSTVIGDYKVLHGMFLREQNRPDYNHKLFRPSEYGGFDVQDFSVLDTALQLVQHKATESIRKCESFTPKLMIIEFARDNYIHALEQFEPTYLKDAHFLFLDAEINTCIERIYRRAMRPNSEDDGFVSEKIVTGYYGQETSLEAISYLQKAFDLNEQHVKFVESIGSRDEFLHDCIGEYARSLMQATLNARRITGPLSPSYLTNTERDSNICPTPLKQTAESSNAAGLVLARR